MKQLRFSLLVFTVCLSLVACGSKGSEKGSVAKSGDLGKPVKLVVSLTAAENADYSAGIRAAKEYIESTSNSNITMEVYYSSALFTQEEELTATAMGDCSITVTNPTWLTTKSPWMGMTAGFMFKNYDHMTAVMNGDIGKDIFKRVSSDQHFLPLSAWYYGTREVSLRKDKDVKTPADMAGINLRMANSEVWLLLGRSLGANATPLSFSDLYMALQTGVVDGQDNPLPTVISNKFYEVQKCIIMTNHEVDSVMPVINLDIWNGMTPAQQQIVRDGMEAGRKVCDKLTLDKETEAVSFLEGKGLKIHYPDVNAFKSHMLEYYLKDPLSKSWDMDLVDRINKAGANY